ncbi:hypothetical protein PCANC_15837 [Puccinia coronata f. sp. avenae]|uniref:Adrenodoxin-NADP(+) reductase n=1 Tax=Puccinia coronata f. sp. avenae TaxID=200324 RepID=A0A2N5SQP5_9BASI|nr:hypothetical protein PCANC_15837 [Puccinia coronata f. sp. avenae]
MTFADWFFKEASPVFGDRDLGEYVPDGGSAPAEEMQRRCVTTIGRRKHGGERGARLRTREAGEDDEEEGSGGRRRYTTSLGGSATAPPIRLAIGGGGPAGFFAASRLFSLDQQKLPGLTLPRPLTIHLFEALPTPYGLSRYGVAPDHPEVKNCETKFAQVAEHPNFQYFGNTTVLGDGQDEPSWGRASVRLRTLREEYDAVLLAYGASRDRSLGGIPGEDTLENILPARAAVEWYNGYPGTWAAETGPRFVDLSTVERVTIVGMGNVALDMARILLTDVDVLARTDMSERALAELARSRVRHVDIVGRRGPLQAAFTTRELRELVSLKHVDMRFPTDLLADAATRLAEPGALARMANGRLRKRLLEVMLKAAERPSLPLGSRTCTLSFLRTPVAFHGRTPPAADTPTRVSEVEWRLNSLDYPSDPLEPVDYSAAKALPIQPPLHHSTSTDLVLKSLGYQPILIPPLTYDSQRSRARNTEGRVIGPDSEVVPGLYVTGWLSRGPRGVIGDTMSEAHATAEVILSDLCASPPRSSLRQHHHHPPSLVGGQFRFDWPMWAELDRLEIARGRAASKPRVKTSSILEMLQSARLL